MQTLLGAHLHLGAHFLAGLFAVIGFDGHDHGFHEATGGGSRVRRIVQRDEADVVRFELGIEHVELAAARQAVIPGANDAVDLFVLHQPAQFGQAKTFQGSGAETFVFDAAVRFPASCLAHLFQFFEVRGATGIVALGLFFGADVGIQREAFAFLERIEGNRGAFRLRGGAVGNGFTVPTGFLHQLPSRHPVMAFPTVRLRVVPAERLAHDHTQSHTIDAIRCL